MFIKPFKVKSNTAIRGSDRRKLRSQITNLFPSLSAEQVSELIPNKDDMTVMKLMTHSGDYVTAFILNGDPIFFEVEKQIFPTVYTLWRYPRIVPVFYTWPPVFENIKGGADLMLPGVILPKEGISGLGTFHKGDVCSVALHGNRAPVAVGSTTISSNDLQEHTMRGKGVLLVHSYLDHMWSQGTKTHLPQLDPLPSGEPAPDEDNVCEQFNEQINLCDKEEESNDNQENLVDDQNLENNINKTRTNDENISQNVDELLNKNGDEDVLTQSAEENKEEGSDKVLEKQTLLGTEDSGNGAEDLEESERHSLVWMIFYSTVFSKGFYLLRKLNFPFLQALSIGTIYLYHVLKDKF